MNDKTREAFAKIYSELSAVENRIESLAEGDLKALIAEIEDSLASDTERPGGSLGMALWRGALAAANEHMAIRRARRSNKGTWYASLQIWRWNETHTEGATEVEKAAKCGSKKQAIARCRDFLREHADHFDECMTIEVQAYPEIEWTPPEGVEIVD